MDPLVAVKGFIKKFMPAMAEQKTAIEYITVLGLFGDQIAGLRELIDQEGDFVEKFSKFCGAFIPFMNARKDRDMKKMLTCWLENYEMYQANLRTLTEYKKRIEAGENHTLREQGGEMENTIDLMKQMLQTDGMILFSQTFEKITGKTIVLDKPYILQSGRSGGPPTKVDSMFNKENSS